MADYTGRFSAELGAMLRRARESRGMSLADVQKESRGRWRAPSLRTYELAERSLKVEDFDELTRFYGLDPPPADEGGGGSDGARGDGSLRLPLVRRPAASTGG